MLTTVIILFAIKIVGYKCKHKKSRIIFLANFIRVCWFSNVFFVEKFSCILAGIKLDVKFLNDEIFTFLCLLFLL